MKKSNAGGARAGAGIAQDTNGEKTGRHTVTLDAATVEKLKILGCGSLSRGIRQACRLVN